MCSTRSNAFEASKNTACTDEPWVRFNPVSQDFINSCFCLSAMGRRTAGRLVYKLYSKALVSTIPTISLQETYDYPQQSFKIYLSFVDEIHQTAWRGYQDVTASGQLSKLMSCAGSSVSHYRTNHRVARKLSRLEKYLVKKTTHQYK